MNGSSGGRKSTKGVNVVGTVNMRPPGVYILVAICERAHEQRITFHGVPRELVETQAGLLDGTSPFYVSPPEPNSVIGKCGLCGAQIHCHVEETEDGTTTRTEP